MLNLLLGIVWLAGAVALFGYELATGEALLRIRGLNISSAWFLLVLAGWNFARWYGSRAGRHRPAEQHALQIAHEARRRRQQERPIEPDPTFDFTDRPAAPPRNVTDQPPSNN
jgi:hypothetical protein